MNPFELWFNAFMTFWQYPSIGAKPVIEVGKRYRGTNYYDELDETEKAISDASRIQD